MLRRSASIRFSSPGDAVIITSEELIGTDPGLPHVGELALRLDHALRKRKVLDHIARTQSRLFVLASVTLNGPHDLILDFQTTLERQSEFVSGKFGPLAINDLQSCRDTTNRQGAAGAADCGLASEARSWMAA